MKKKKFLIIGIVLLLLVMIAQCGSGETQDPSGETPSISGDAGNSQGEEPGIEKPEVEEPTEPEVPRFGNGTYLVGNE